MRIKIKTNPYNSFTHHLMCEGKCVGWMQGAFIPPNEILLTKISLGGIKTKLKKHVNLNKVTICLD